MHQLLKRFRKECFILSPENSTVPGIPLVPVGQKSILPDNADVIAIMHPTPSEELILNGEQGCVLQKAMEIRTDLAMPGGADSSLILVHSAGSFRHPQAEEHDSPDGFSNFGITESIGL